MQDLISIGIIAPISATFKHSADFFKLTRQYISEALPKDIYKEPSLVSDKEGNDRLNRIIGGLVDSDVVVVDKTDKNPNVMLELGMRAAFDLPFVLIQLESQEYPSVFKMQDIIPIPNTNDESTINNFKARLLEKGQPSCQSPQ
ncbi:hypothetical protein ACFQ3L_00340 [Lacticaseibacillus jixianensis]|uniref:Nucleoside 2-deoxyribosyltransferase n=1 Tax=Lacticaseibacillus jixianensis TaxID=2486012 RepID=A0ABW4B7A0_9LACO|nr:hypothetical protein [Lacticaseibacillus jixianensis]